MEQGQLTHMPLANLTRGVIIFFLNLKTIHFNLYACSVVRVCAFVSVRAHACNI